MSDILDTDVAPFCHGQIHSGSVPVPAVGESAVLAPEVSLVQFESFGSRETGTARHGRVCGPDHHHRPPGPPGTLDEFPLRRTDRGVSGLACHGGFGQEQRFEVLDGDQVVGGDDSFGPYPGIVDGLPGGFLRQLSSLSPGLAVTPRLCSAFAVTAGHLPLRSRQLGRASLPMSEVRQIEGRRGGRRRGEHAPADTDPTFTTRVGRDLAAYHERGVPAAQAVAVDANRRGRRGKLSRLHHRNRDALRQHQPAITDREPACGVLQRRQGSPAGLDLRMSAPAHLERVVQRPRVIAQHLLLGNLGSLAQPREFRPSLGGVPHHLIYSNILSKGVVMRHGRRSCFHLPAVSGWVSQAEIR